MSRRRVSVKDLGVVDCEGWLYHRKETRSFLRSKWKRYWFVLKGSSLYWYKDHMADSAEGFMDLCGASIHQSQQRGRKHVLTASRPQVRTVAMAAETFSDMNKWITRLTAAAELCDLMSAEGCYSEGSDQDSEDQTCPLDLDLDPAQWENGDEATSCFLQSESRRRSVSEAAGLNRNRRRRKPTGSGERLSWLDLPQSLRAGTGAPLPPVHGDGERVQQKVKEKPPDEMESLYIHLQAASSSLIGQRDFRASFIRRCQNERINGKLHELRILSSTLKAKELELLAVEQILSDPSLSPPSYRKWKLSNSILLQEIRDQAAGGAAEPRPPEQLSES